jgi:acetoacetate decarboxylase
MTVSHPAAPWNLQGHALQTLHLVSVENARPLIPLELEIISVLPGKTLGGVYLSAYESGSLLQYNELIIVPAFVRFQGKIGAWISHIYVDNEISVAGGREIWGLPKEMANFIWKKDSVSVFQKERQLCRLNYQKDWFSLSSWWKLPLSGDVFGGLESDLLLFTGKFQAKLEVVKGNLEIPSESLFASLNLKQPLLSINCQQLELIAGEPHKIGKKTPRSMTVLKQFVDSDD